MKILTPPPLAPKRIAHLNSWTSFSISRDISTVSLTTALGPSITKITLIHISYIIFHIFTCYFVYFHWATDSSYCIITGGHWQRSIEHWSELWAVSHTTIQVSSLSLLSSICYCMYFLLNYRNAMWGVSVYDDNLGNSFCKIIFKLNQTFFVTILFSSLLTITHNLSWLQLCWALFRGQIC